MTYFLVFVSILCRSLLWWHILYLTIDYNGFIVVVKLQRKKSLSPNVSITFVLTLIWHSEQWLRNFRGLRKIKKEQTACKKPVMLDARRCSYLVTIVITRSTSCCFWMVLTLLVQGVRMNIKEESGQLFSSIGISSSSSSSSSIRIRIPMCNKTELDR